MSMNNRVSAITVHPSSRQRHHKLTCCILAIISACPSSSSRAKIVSVVSAEFHPRAIGVHHHAPLAFLPHDGQRHNGKRRRRSQHYRTSPPHSSLSNLLFELRCGGLDESSVKDEDDISETDAILGDTQQQQPIVDISVVENVDSSRGGSDSITQNGIDADAESIVSDEEDEYNSGLPESDDTSDQLGTSAEGTQEGSNDVDSSMESSDETDISEMSSQSSDNITPEGEIDTETQQFEVLRSSASEKRAEGKTLHDSGSLADAAHAFHEAASLFDEVLAVSYSNDAEDTNSVAIERATCRLHEALCLLKDGRPGDCIEACSDVLEDGVTVVPLEEADEGEGDDDDDTENTNESPAKPTAMVKIVPSPVSSTSSYSVPPQIRARAHHRRAKARLALGDLDGALEDARSAAFMGDRNAVQFYGRLMREGSGAAASSGEAALPMGGLGGASPFGGTSDGSNQFLESMVQGMGGNNNPLMPSSGAGSSDFSSSLLSSLLTSGAGDSGAGGGSPFGLMGDLLAPQTNNDKMGKSGKRRRGKKKKDSLAKSVLTSLMKKIENEETQEQICNYLRSTNTQQIMSFATMAGVPIKEESARRLVTLAKGVTPERISKSISKVKRGVSIFKTGRKFLKVIDKYKAFIILAVLCYWVRSAITQPYPISKKQKEAAKKLAQKAALGLLIMPSSSPSCSQNGRGGMLKALGTRLLQSDSESIEFDNDSSSSTSQTGIEQELERLQYQLSLIEALEERNRAQLESFVDEEDQWQSLEQGEQDLLKSKGAITQKMEELAEELVLLFMGQKLRDG